MFKNKFLIFFYLAVFYGSSQDILLALALSNGKTGCALPFHRARPIDQITISQLEKVLYAGCNREIVKKMLQLYPGYNVTVYTGRVGTSYVVSDSSEFRTDSPTVSFEITHRGFKDYFMGLQAAKRSLICNYLRTEGVVIGDDDAERIAFLNRDDVQNLTWLFHSHTYDVYDKKDLLEKVLGRLKTTKVSEISVFAGRDEVKKEDIFVKKGILFGEVLKDFLRSHHNVATAEVEIFRVYPAAHQPVIVHRAVVIDPEPVDPRLSLGSYCGLRKPLANRQSGPKHFCIYGVEPVVSKKHAEESDALIQFVPKKSPLAKNDNLLILEPKAVDVKAGRKSQEDLDPNKIAAVAVERRLRARMVADQNFVDMPLD